MLRSMCLGTGFRKCFFVVYRIWDFFQPSILVFLGGNADFVCFCRHVFFGRKESTGKVSTMKRLTTAILGTPRFPFILGVDPSLENGGPGLKMYTPIIFSHSNGEFPPFVDVFPV